MHDPEVSFGLVLHFPRWVALETEQYLETDSDETRMYRQVEQVTSGRNHARQLRYAVSKGNVLERS